MTLSPCLHIKTDLAVSDTVYTGNSLFGLCRVKEYVYYNLKQNQEGNEKIMQVFNISIDVKICTKTKRRKSFYFT